MLPEQKKKPRKHRVFKALMAEAVGFEPTCPCGQLHFECSSLQPLRYASVYKYSLLGTNHMISSQPRYDHFDTSPCIFNVNRAFGKMQEKHARTILNYRTWTPEKPYITGISGGRNYQSCQTFRVSPIITTSISLCDLLWWHLFYTTLRQNARAGRASVW